MGMEAYRNIHRLKQAKENLLVHVPPSEISIVDGFNPRTAWMSVSQREAVMGEEALRPMIESMRRLGADGHPIGVITPMTVVEEPRRPGSYQLVAGERRLRAAQFAGLDQVPVQVVPGTLEDALPLAIMENEQREDTDPMAQTLSGLKLICRVTGLERADAVSLVRRLRKHPEEDEHKLGELIHSVFGITLTSWALRRAPILDMTDDEREALSRGLSLDAAIAISRAPSPIREQALERVMGMLPLPSATQVAALLKEYQPPVKKPSRSWEDSVRRLSSYSRLLRDLPPDAQAESERILKEAAERLEAVVNRGILGSKGG